MRLSSDVTMKPMLPKLSREIRNQIKGKNSLSNYMMSFPPFVCSLLASTHPPLRFYRVPLAHSTHTHTHVPAHTYIYVHTHAHTYTCARTHTEQRTASTRAATGCCFLPSGITATRSHPLLTTMDHFIALVLPEAKTR